jgi:hypothetical protein
MATGENRERERERGRQREREKRIKGVRDGALERSENAEG